MAQIETPFISVVIPSYNAENVIGRTIESVLSQSYENWELLVIDDGSTDNTRGVVRGFSESDTRINLIALDKNHGAPAAPRNIGVREAQGVWIAFLDSDDIWHPEKLELQLSIVNERKVGFCATSSVSFISDSELEFQRSPKITATDIKFSQQRLKGRIVNSSVLVKRDYLIKVPLNESPEYKAVEDYHCWLQILEKLDLCVKIDFPLVGYRHVEGQISGSKYYMLKKVFMVHSEYSNSNFLSSLFYTFTHAVGGFYFRYLKGGL
jgi:teichuronic acid biosynthesis glycosyltransferase TuaG